MIFIIKIQGRGTALLLLVNHSTTHQLSSEKKMFRLALHCCCFMAMRINNYFKRTSAIKVATMNVTDNFCYEWKPLCAYHKIGTFRGEQG